MRSARFVFALWAAALLTNLLSSPCSAQGEGATPVNYKGTGGKPCLRPLYNYSCLQEMDPLVDGKPNPDRAKVEGDERLPCCACLKLGTKVKGWPCGNFKSPGHVGIITKDIIDYCHPALEYESTFKQAKDDDMVPSASWCPNNFAHGKDISYQFMCDEKTGALVCGGGNRAAGRTLVLINSGSRQAFFKTISAAVAVLSTVILFF